MGYQVFISFKNQWENKPTRDSAIAAQLYAELKKYDVEVFFSNEEILRKGRPDYGRLIDSALESARVLLLVGTRGEFVKARWVEYEWDLFNTEICSGRKDGKIITVLEGMDIGELPIGMRRWQSYDLKKSTAADVAEMTINTLSVLTGQTYIRSSGNASQEEDPKRIAFEGSDWFFGLCGKAQDYKKAFGCWLKAAEMGYVKAQYDVGMCFMHGWGTETDKDQAKHWFHLAAAGGYKDAEKELKSLS